MNVYIASRSAVIRRDGRRVVIKEGITRAAEGSWIVKDYPDLFARADENLHFDVEEATAVPGEKRGEPEHVCGECGKAAKTAAGLSAHKRSHD